MSHSVNGQAAEFHWSRVRLFDETACRVILQKLQENPMATVTSVESKPKSKWRPQAMDTVEMEKLAVRKLRITAKKAMTIAESLYTRGFISYPRTETNIFPKELNLQKLVENHKEHPNWGGFASHMLNQSGPRPRNGKKTDNAHPPIHPTKCAFPGQLKDDDARLYELITRHFLACCSADAEGKEYIVEVNINGESFIASGLTILALNYLEVYPYEKWAEKTIPEYQVHQQFQPTVLDIQDGQTAPPPLLNEADLIGLMEKYGIGTDATHAEHIDKIQQRLYVGVTNDGRFTPGTLGMALVEGYDAMGFAMSKPNLRAEFEADLCKICDGTVDPHTVLIRYIDKYREIFQQSASNVQLLDDACARLLGTQPENVDPNTDDGYGDGFGGGGGGGGSGGGGGGGGFGGPSGGGDSFPLIAQCPQCSNEIRGKTTKQGVPFIGCFGFPNCKVAWFPPNCVDSFTVSETTCNNCSFHPHLIVLNFKPEAIPYGMDNP